MIENDTQGPPRGVRLRPVEESDLPQLFEDQRDPVATEMAAFPARDRDAFMAHWGRILANDDVIKRTILVGEEVAGNIVCFEQEGRHLIGYWVGRRHWGRCVATLAATQFLRLVTARPLHAYVAKQNLGSIRVLEKCGFSVSEECSAPASATEDEVEEYFYTLSV